MSQCKTTEYFDSTELGCMACPGILTPSSDKTKCECPKGYIIDGTTKDLFSPKCIQCTGNTVPSRDKSQCMACVAPSTFDSTWKDCLCGQDSRIVEKAQVDPLTNVSQ